MLVWLGTAKDLQGLSLQFVNLLCSQYLNKAKVDICGEGKLKDSSLDSRSITSLYCCKSVWICYMAQWCTRN